MAINSISYGNSVLGQATQSLKSQMQTLQTQLSTGKKSTTYSGMGVNEGFAIAARNQLSNIGAFTDAATKVSTTIQISNTALQSLSAIGTQVKSLSADTSQTLNANGQSTAQQIAAAQLSSMLGILNTQAGDRYVFSGNAIDTPAVASADDILNGNGAAAGLKQVIAERRQADVGTSGLGRLALTQPTPSSVSVAEDAAGSPFGLKLQAVASSLTGATVTGPAGSPPALSIDLGATNPNDGDSLSLSFTLPDGTSDQIKLTASSTTPTPSGSFAIGATPADTANNLKAALNTAIGTVADTSLVAASAMAASANFFGSPPQRVSGSPLGSATSLAAGNSANTVQWYTGDAGAGSARASALSRIDDSTVVQYGIRANETAFTSQLQAIAAFAATSSSGANAGSQVSALSQRVTQKLTPSSGQQTISDIQSDLSTATSVMADAKARQTQTKSMLQTVVDQAETVSPDDVAVQLLSLQTNLQASYQTTSMLSQLTLLKYL